MFPTRPSQSPGHMLKMQTSQSSTTELVSKGYVHAALLTGTPELKEDKHSPMKASKGTLPKAQPHRESLKAAQWPVTAHPNTQEAVELKNTTFLSNKSAVFPDTTTVSGSEW